MKFTPVEERDNAPTFAPVSEEDEVLDEDTILDDVSRQSNYVGRRLASGFLNTFGNSPEAQKDLGLIGRFTPNVVWSLGGLAGLVSGNLDSPWVQKSLKYANSGIQQGLDMTNLEPVSGTRDTFLDIVGGNLVPGVGAFKAATIPQKVAKGVATVLAPGVQSKTGLGLAAEFGIPTVIGDQVGEAFDPSYKSDIANWRKPKFVPTDDEPPTFKPVEPTFTAVEDRPLELEDTIENKSWTDKDMVVGAATLALLSGTGIQMARSIYKSKNARKMAYNDSEILGRNDMAVAEARKVSPKRQEAAVLRNTDGETMNVTPSPDGYFNKLTLWDAQTRDAGALFRKVLKDIKKAGKISVGKYEEVLDMMVTQFEAPAQAVRLKDWVKSGQFINSKKFTHSAVVLEEAAAKLLKASPEKWQKLNESLVLGTRLDQIKDPLTKAKSWGKYNAAAMKRIIEANDADPIVKAMRQQHLEFYRDVLDDMYKNPMNGLASRETYLKWKKGNPNYVPQKLEGAGAYDADMFKHRNPDLTEGLQPGSVAPPTDAIGEYAIRMGQFSLDNNARRTFIDLLHDTETMVTNKSRQLAERIDVGKNFNEDEAVKIIRNGHEEYWRINDPYLKNLLQESPDWASKHYNWLEKAAVAVTNMFKIGTVGKLNPVFVFKSAGYDTLATFIQAPIGQNIGIISRKLNEAFNTTNTLRHDPTAFFNPIHGAAKAVWSDVMFAGVRSMKSNQAIGKTTGLAELLGKNYEPFMKRMEQAYLKSGKRLYERQGSGTTLLWGDSLSTHPDIMRELAPMINKVTPGQPIQINANVLKTIKSHLDPNSSSIFRRISALLDAGHSGNRLGAFSQNLERSWTFEPMQWISKSGKVHRFPNLKIPSSKVGATVGQMQHSARIFREVGGDLGKKAGIPGTASGAVARLTGDVVPFTNPAIQASTRLAKALKEDWWNTSGAIFALGGVGMGYIFNSVVNDPERLQIYREWGASNRGRRIPIFNDKNEIISTFDIAHEYRPAWSGALEATLQLRDIIAKEDSDPLKAAFDRFWQDVMPFGGGIPLANLTHTVATGTPLNYAVQDGINYFTGMKDTRNALRGATNPNANRNRILDEESDSEIYKRVSGALNEIVPIHHDALIHSGLSVLRAWEGKSGIETMLKQLTLNITPTVTQQGSYTAGLFPQAQQIQQRKNRSFDWVSDVYNTTKKIKQWNRFVAAHQAHPERRRTSATLPMETTSTLPARLKSPEIADMINNMMKRLQSDLKSPAFGKLQTVLSDISYNRDGDFLNIKDVSTPTAQRTRYNEYNIAQLEVLRQAQTLIDTYEQDIRNELGDQTFSFTELGMSPETREIINESGNPDPFMPYTP